MYSCDLTLIHHYITQILEEAKLDSHADDLIDFMAREVLATASKLQSRKDNTGLPPPGPCGQAFTNQVVDRFGQEYIQCVAGLSVQEVCKGRTIFCTIPQNLIKIVCYIDFIIHTTQH